MSNIFISHVEEDKDIALQIAQGLEAAGYTTWYYERDSVPGPTYLAQTSKAIEECQCVLVLISKKSLTSNQLINEVVRAYEAGKCFIPVLCNITHSEFQKQEPTLRQCLGASTSINVLPDGISSILPRILQGLRLMYIFPNHTQGDLPLKKSKWPESKEYTMTLVIQDKDKEWRQTFETTDIRKILIGREKDMCHIVLNSPTVSRIHAIILFNVNGEWEIEDLQSRVGILLNGNRIRSAILKVGDQIKIGESVISVEKITEI